MPLTSLSKPLTAETAAQQVQERLKALHQLVHDIDKKRFVNEQGIVALQSYHQDEKGGQSSQVSKKLMLYLQTNYCGWYFFF